MKPRHLLLGSALLVAVVPAHAVTYYWDSDGTTPGFGDANGTWGSGTFWSTVTGTGASAGTAIPFRKHLLFSGVASIVRCGDGLPMIPNNISNSA